MQFIIRPQSLVSVLVAVPHYLRRSMKTSLIEKWLASVHSHWSIIRELFSFGLVGVTNTLLGYSIIFGCMYWLQFSPFRSNLIGYSIVLVCSFLLNKRYVFKGKNKIVNELALFLFSFLLAYLANLAALKSALLFVNPYVSQVLAGVVYTGSFFLLCKFMVFRR
jgi:putative flippase GtrA